MADIKVKEIKDKTVKSLDKTIAWTERVKDSIVYLDDKSKDSVSNDTTISEYGENKLEFNPNIQQLFEPSKTESKKEKNCLFKCRV